MASSNSSSSSETEQLDEVKNNFMITVPLFKTLGFTQPLVDKINRGIFRVKLDRNFVYFAGLKFFGLKPDGDGIRNEISMHRIHISVYQEGSQRIKLGETNFICQLTSETLEIDRIIDQQVRLEPGIEYEIRYEYSGPKVRFGKNRTSEPFMHYNRFVGTIGFSVEMIQGKNNRVAGLIFTVNGIPQLELARDKAEAEHLESLLSSNKIDDIKKHLHDHATCSSNAPVCPIPICGSLDAKQIVEFHSDYAMKETIEEHHKHSVELKFRCNKRVVIGGMFFTGWRWTLPYDAEQNKSTYLIENLEIVDAGTKIGLASSEKWGFQVFPNLMIPLSFIHSLPIAPDEWHILKLEFNGPVMRYGTKPRSTISVDTERGEKVVWTLDLENSKNIETLHSLVYQCSEDQSKQTASPDQDC